MDLKSSILEYHDNIQYATLSDKAYNILAEFIISLELLPGNIYKESDICDSIKLGRTPTREAFKKLESSKIVSILPRNGIKISNFSFEDFDLCREVRCSVEEIAIMRTSRLALPHERKYLKSLVEKYIKFSQDRDILNLIRCDREFHLCVSNYSRNKYIADILQSFTLAECRLFYLTFSDPNTPLETFAEINHRHINMMNHIIDGNGPEAVSLLKSFDYQTRSLE